MKNDSWSMALRIMARMSGWIAFPVIIGMFLGKWLDKRYGTEPWLLLTTIGVCFLISMFGLIRDALKEFKKIEKEYAANKIKDDINKKDKNKEDLK